MAIGSVWETTSWDEDAWGDVWGEGGVTSVFETLVFAAAERTVLPQSVERNVVVASPTRVLKGEPQ